MSSRRSATTWMTLSSRCNLPVQRSKLAPSVARRKRSRMAGQTIRLATPVSSSMVTKTTPLTLPALLDQHDPGDREPPVDWQMSEVFGGDQALAGKFGAQKGERVALQGEPEAGIILNDMLAQRHFRQERHSARFAVLPRSSRLRGESGGRKRGLVRGGEQRQRRFAERFQGPQRAPPVEPDRTEGVGFGEALAPRPRPLRRHSARAST
jgi:hypothetical protein